MKLATDRQSRGQLFAVSVAALIVFALLIVVLFQAAQAYVLHQAEDEIENMLLQHKGVHQYVQQLNHPELYRLKDEGAITEALYTPVLFSSSYMVRNMHAFYNVERQRLGRPPLYYKMAAYNPRNPLNRADAWEEELIRRFDQNPELKEHREIVTRDGQKYLYVAIPFLRNTQACLTCHGNREDAPGELQARYPGQGGFNEKVGNLRAIESIRTPLSHDFSFPYIVAVAAAIVVLGLLGLSGVAWRLRLAVVERTALITEQARGLRLKEENLRITLHSIGDAVIATDVNGCVRQMNPIAEMLTGWSIDEALGSPLKQVFQIVNGQTRRPCADPVEKVIESGEIVGLANHTILISRNGHEYQIADSGAPIRDDNGTIVGVVMVFRDVTETYNMEEKMRQSQKMEAIGQLAGGIAHDFNNVLGGIVGSAELLDDIIKSEPVHGECREAIDVIIQSVERARELTSRLLLFARRTSVELKAVDMHQMINDVVHILEHAIDRRIVIKKMVNAQRPVVSGDAGQLQSALLNLGINASQAMPGGGCLEFQTRDLLLAEEDCNHNAFSLTPGNYLEISVRDTGCGIPAADIGSIFEPFFTTKSPGEGTGLGLATVYGTVKHHHGSITVYSEPGQGAVFMLLLPQMEGSTPVEKNESLRPRGQGRILLVDDEKSMRRMATIHLTKLGYQVVGVENGQLALEQMASDQEEFDLVLLDLTMPVMDGRECLQEIRRLNPDIPVIICSGFYAGGQGNEMKNYGADGFLVKPFRIGELAQIVARFMTRDT